MPRPSRTSISSTSAALTEISATLMALASEKVSTTPTACTCSSGHAPDMAMITRSSTLGMTRLSTSVDPALSTPAATEALTAATSPPTTMMYFPAHTVWAVIRFTSAVLTI